jgi:cell division protein FtsQ
VANGNIHEPFPVSESRYIFPSRSDSVLKPNIIYDLYKLAMFIDGNEFWRSQIEQIFVNGYGEIEMIPRMGAHTILLGRVNDMEYKFQKLKSIYYTFNQIGWNDYKTINLKYKEQVICTKR